MQAQLHKMPFNSKRRVLKPKRAGMRPPAHPRVAVPAAVLQVRSPWLVPLVAAALARRLPL